MWNSVPQNRTGVPGRSGSQGRCHRLLEQNPSTGTTIKGRSQGGRCHPLNCCRNQSGATGQGSCLGASPRPPLLPGVSEGRATKGKPLPPFVLDNPELTPLWTPWEQTAKPSTLSNAPPQLFSLTARNTKGRAPPRAPPKRHQELRESPSGRSELTIFRRGRERLALAGGSSCYKDKSPTSTEMFSSFIRLQKKRHYSGFLQLDSNATLSDSEGLFPLSGHRSFPRPCTQGAQQQKLQLIAG